MGIAADVADIVYGAARGKLAARARSGALPPKLAVAPLGLVAGGAVAYTMRQRRKAAERKARDADVQVRRERQATQAVVTTCAYLLAATEEV